MVALRKILVGLGLTLVAGGAALLLYAVRYIDEPLPLSEPAVIDIPAGKGLNGVAADLAARGLLKHPRVFALYGRWMSASARIKAGEYRIEPGQTPAGLLEQFVAGQVMLHSITLIEGWTFAQAVEAIRRHPAVVVASEGMTDQEIAHRLELPTDSPEGWLLPDTYHFARGTEDLALMAIAATAMEEALDRAWSERVPDLPLDSPYQALILASIIEKETGLAQERPRISGVFVRRLERGMRLQTDPTVIYGLGPKFDGNLRKSDLNRDTPYNSYTRSGLPPTPIALPGRKALVAAVQPADEGALYFVATGEGDGSHYFSATLEEHNQAVARYLARLRERKD
jgi:UPF0755 protein